jgi:microcystin-dependent protein
MNLGRTFIYYDEVALGVGSSAFWVDSAPFNMSVLSSLDNIILAPRTASAPSIGFTTDTSTGFFSPQPGQFTIVSVGSSILNVNPNGVNISGAMTATSLDASAGFVTAATLRGQNLTVYNVSDSQGPLWARTEAIIGTRSVVTNSAEVNIRQGNVDISGIVTSTSGFRGNINSSGVSTISRLQSTNINATGISTIINLQSTNVNIIGVTTVGVVTGGTSVQATNFYGNGTIPIGGIIMWSGSIATIPTGWALCNGSNGTPDLRNQFIVGAGSDTLSVWGFNKTTGVSTFTGGQSYVGVGSTGGRVGVALTIGEMPAHTHTYNQNTNANTDHSGSDTTSNNPSFSSQPTGSTGGDLYHENRPPYYALAFIMRTI